MEEANVREIDKYTKCLASTEAVLLQLSHHQRVYASHAVLKPIARLFECGVLPVAQLG